MKKSPHKKIEHVIDAKGKILGRLASEVAVLLQGKATAEYEQSAAGSAMVFIKNAGQIKVSGNKLKGKKYYHHSGYIGSMKSKTLEEVMAKDSTEPIRRAVYNMLPKNRLRKVRMNHLKIEG